MGANMQHQAVPLMIPQAPLVGPASRSGRGQHRRRRARHGDGTVIDVDADEIVVEGRGSRDEYPLTSSCGRSRARIHQKPVVELGDKVRKEVPADGSSTDGGELALGANLLVAFMPFEG